jgi:hypothetical protein
MMDDSATAVPLDTMLFTAGLDADRPDIFWVRITGARAGHGADADQGCDNRCHP